MYIQGGGAQYTADNLNMYLPDPGEDVKDRIASLKCLAIWPILFPNASLS